MADSVDASVALIKALLQDPDLRTQFRRQPVDVCRAHGLDELADQIAEQPRGMVTLELRESRSSLAGVVLAAAAEGIDIAHVAARAAPHVEADAAAALHHMLDGLSSHKHPHPTHAPSGQSVSAQSPGIPSLKPAPLTPSPAAVPRVPPGPTLAGAAPPGPAAQAPPSTVPQTAPGAAAQNAPAPASATQHTPGEPHPAGAAATPPVHVAHPGVIATDHAVGTPLGTDIPYPGDGAPKDQIAAWMAARAVRAGLPAELPVMAALTESSLTNTPTGDRDSVGYFQMRTSIWDKGPYSGYQHQPALQLQWFIDHALAVKNQSGDPHYGADPSTWGNWIADIEQPAAQYRYRYQLQLDHARQLLSAFHAQPPQHAGAQSAPHPGSAPVASTPAQPQPSAPDPAAPAVQFAMHQVGTAGAGSDSASLVQSAYQQLRVYLPGSAADQFNAGTSVAADQLRAGDVVFFRDSTGSIHHEGIYIGEGRFVHAPESGGSVEVSRLDEPYFAQQYAGARRFAPEASAHFARTMPVIEAQQAAPAPHGATITSSGYALPLEAKYMATLGRTDDGVDIETPPDGAIVYSITPGVVTAVASDPSGFGPSYPVVQASGGSLAGHCIYYGHVAKSLVQPGEHVAAGQPIAIIGHTGDAAYIGHGHIEIGFSDAGGNPLNHHGAQAATPEGQRMRDFLNSLTSGH